MSEPWNLRKNDGRSSDTLTTFIIFCEDEYHEKYYLEHFQQLGGLKINAIGNQKQSRLNLNNAVHECIDLELLKFDGDGYKLKEGITEHIWCVYDRDVESNEPEKVQPKDNIDFDVAIQTAKNVGLKVAWSNDAFELWVLLHFEQVPCVATIHRSWIYQRLTDIFRVIEPRSPELDAITSRPHFNYKSSLKHRDTFINYVRPLLHNRTQTAIDNAKHLELQFLSTVPFHQRNPCTRIHHLVEEILHHANGNP